MADRTNISLIKRIAYIVNTCILLCVVGLLGVFYYFHVDYMVYHSLATLLFYILFYYVIKFEHFSIFCWTVYFLITIYMGASTICLGNTFGFNLYCISMIPIVFYAEYMGAKLHTRKPHTTFICVCIILMYLLSTAHTLVNGPVYTNVPKEAGIIFHILNSIIVFNFLFVYTKLMVKMIMESEEKLSYMAHYDNLTGLLNRHYMMETLHSLHDERKIGWIAMLDIDKFKSVNDTYGHNAGDFVLKSLKEIISEVCTDCTVARWGGEEFLMIPNDSNSNFDVLELLRSRVEQARLNFEGKEIKFTISIGAVNYDFTSSVEKCIQKADLNLYTSKNTGRNKVTVS